jgi:hypothetical protein
LAGGFTTGIVAFGLGGFISIKGTAQSAVCPGAAFGLDLFACTPQSGVGNVRKEAVNCGGRSANAAAEIANASNVLRMIPMIYRF